MTQLDITGPALTHTDHSTLKTISQRVLWLSAAIVDAANRGRTNATGVKVGGHQSSSASMVTRSDRAAARRQRRMGLLAPQSAHMDLEIYRSRPIFVPTALPRLSLGDALATVELPLHLNCSDRGRRYGSATDANAPG